MKRYAHWMMPAVLILGLMSEAALAQTAGKITEVRVYQGQALVTRELAFEAKGGAQQVLVTELPEQILPDSLYAVGDDTVAIRAVRFRATATAEEPRPEVRELDKQIKDMQKDQRRIESELSVLENRSDFLDNVEQFAATKAQEELEKGSLRPETLEQTTKFITEQREEIAKKQLALEDEQEGIQEQLSVLQRKRSALVGKAHKSVREAVVFVDAAKAGAAKLKLSYLVSGVGWSPAYSARINEKRDGVSLEYHAVVSQMSGEDWPDVKLTLSTSNPKMLAAAPILSPLRISLVPVGQVTHKLGDTEAYSNKRQQLEQQIRAPKSKAGPRGDRGPVGPTGPRGDAGPPAPPGQYGIRSSDDEFLAANVFAAELQNLELAAPDEVVKLARAMRGQTTEGLAVEYPLPGSISLQSRKDQQMFHIATLDLKASFYYTAAPLLTDYVYQAVECVNNSEYPLLAGPYNAYVGGAFAGRGELPLVARGQGLTIGFGTETRLRAARELDKKETTTRGGNNVVKYTYRLRLQNYTDKPAKIQLWDRLPQAKDKQVTITQPDPDPPLSKDPLYVAQHKPRGLLRWDVEVPAKASADKALKFTYQFTIEFDKNFDIGELPASVADSMRKEIKALRSIQAGAALK